MPSTPERQLPRCTMCGMGCTVGAERDEMGRVRTLYPSDLGASQGACVLGVTAARLVGAEDRLFRGRVDGQEATLARATDALAARIRAASPDRVAVVVDLNRPLEGLGTAARLRIDTGADAMLCAFVPPQDVPLVAAGVRSCPPFAKLSECDVVLTIGDVCSSHPVVARPLRDMQRAGRHHRWLCLDSAPGRTSRSADEAVIVPADAMAAAVAALAVACGAGGVADAVAAGDASAICKAAGLDETALDGLARALDGAESPGVVVSCSTGRFAAPEGVVAAARELARCRSAQFWALPLATNGLALPSLKDEWGLQSLAELHEALVNERVDVLLMIGFDPSSALPAGMWRQGIEGCQTTAWAGSLDCAFAAEADIVLPLALPWEESGSCLTAQGEVQEVSRWLAPPDGVPTVVELLLALAGGLGAPSPEPMPLSAAGAQAGGGPPVQSLLGPEVLERQELTEGQALLIGAPEPHGYTGGLGLATARWQRHIAHEEKALCGAGVPAPAAGVLALEGNGRFAVPARAASGGTPWPAAAVALPAHWEACRELLSWRMVEGIGPVAEPAVVRVSVEE